MSENATTPPWGSADEFNPEKAWSLIQNLRAERDEHRSKVEALTSERNQFEAQVTEFKSAAEQAQELARKFESDLGSEQFGRQFDNLAHSKGIPLNLASTIKADSLEDAEAKLDALAAWRGETAKAEPKPDPAQAAEPAVDERVALAQQFFGK